MAAKIIIVAAILAFANAGIIKSYSTPIITKTITPVVSIREPWGWGQSVREPWGQSIREPWGWGQSIREPWAQSTPIVTKAIQVEPIVTKTITPVISYPVVAKSGW